MCSGDVSVAHDHDVRGHALCYEQLTAGQSVRPIYSHCRVGRSAAVNSTLRTASSWMVTSTQACGWGQRAHRHETYPMRHEPSERGEHRNGASRMTAARDSHTGPSSKQPPRQSLPAPETPFNAHGLPRRQEPRATPRASPSSSSPRRGWTGDRGEGGRPPRAAAGGCTGYENAALPRAGRRGGSEEVAAAAAPAERSWEGSVRTPVCGAVPLSQTPPLTAALRPPKPLRGPAAAAGSRCKSKRRHGPTPGRTRRHRPPRHGRPPRCATTPATPSPECEGGQNKAPTAASVVTVSPSR